MENNTKEYITFQTTTKDGTEVEMAVIDEFDFDNKHYVAASLIQDDEILSDGVYIYRCVIKGEDFKIEKITKQFEYNQVVNAYMSMEDEETE